MKSFAVYCQSLPRFEHEGHFLSNNSLMYYPDIGFGESALKCVANSKNCCSDVGGWRDERERPVQEGNGVACLYATRTFRIISLHRKSGCTDHTSGLWRCDIPDSSGEMQSLYIYISSRRSYGELCYFILCHSPSHWNIGQLNPSVSMNFTLHTEPRTSVPEFTISCRTHGGPATTVQWTVNGVPVQENSDHETSQLILDTSLNSVYDNRLRVRGRRNGTYFCSVMNNIKFYLRDAAVDNVNTSEILLGKLDDEVYKHGLTYSTVAGEPTSLTAVISESNSTHVNITVSWKSPGDPVTDYVIYYQSKGGPVISDRVSGGETETHSMDGLQRGVTYYISIVALSPHLPSPLVGPTTVIPGESLPLNSSF